MLGAEESRAGENGGQEHGAEFPPSQGGSQPARAVVRREGPADDLPIARGWWTWLAFFPHECIDGMVDVGELSLECSPVSLSAIANNPLLDQ